MINRDTFVCIIWNNMAWESIVRCLSFMYLWCDLLSKQRTWRVLKSAILLPDSTEGPWHMMFGTQARPAAERSSNNIQQQFGLHWNCVVSTLNSFNASCLEKSGNSSTAHSRASRVCSRTASANAGMYVHGFFIRTFDICNPFKFSFGMRSSGNP